MKAKEVKPKNQHKIMLKSKKLIDADDPAYHLDREILEAEEQIKRGEVTPWSEIKRKHKL